jgi:hypothetical protein
VRRSFVRSYSLVVRGLSATERQGFQPSNRPRVRSADWGELMQRGDHELREALLYCRTSKAGTYPTISKPKLDRLELIRAFFGHERSPGLKPGRGDRRAIGKSHERR